ncbi:hypothetical protein C2E21_9056 [Chlorella sorokiniana]|uniref:SBP-type domain-containing protein n=1 Tax=Chlorella sorokiniana TaxID=3076 RepID=A0A2P6TCI0_CHLSO|nr:hypothetical protein C2E21_9056 [Chlorella sorokiniana]|eukprot:PRW20351.1 hypothetical protein C2E21_9056 [Chlorella sorokiniana]
MAARAEPHPDRRHEQLTSGVEELRDVEADPRYRRVDYSTLHAYDARQAFLRCIQQGEGLLELSAAALHIAAEDDALVSHSTVQLPVPSYQQRLQRMAAELASQYLPAALQRWEQQAAAAEAKEAGTGEGGSGSSSEGSSEGGGSSESSSSSVSGRDEALLREIQRYLFEVQGFRVPGYGRSNLPDRAVVDHPGVWESAGHAYLNEVLVTKRGIPAALAIVLADLVRRLLLLGAIDFAVKVDCRDLGRLPVPHILPGVRRTSVVRPDGTVLNTCTSEALAEVLRFLKRCYWPFKWDSSSGGFASAASVFLEGEQDGEMEAISRTAKHRLERGIWTSPGAGDIRRAVAACERLVLLCGEACPWERRDLAVLYMHLGQFREAKAELLAFSRSPFPSSAWPSFAAGAATAAGLPPSFALTPTGAVVGAGGQSLWEQQLTDRLLQLLSGCAKPHTLDHFDEGRRSCRESLQRHNYRRRPLGAGQVTGLAKRRSAARDAAPEVSGGTNSTVAWQPAVGPSDAPAPSSLSGLDPSVAALLHLPLPQLLPAQLPAPAQRDGVNRELLQTALALQQRVEELEQQLAAERAELAAERAQRAQHAARLISQAGAGGGVHLLRARVRVPGTDTGANVSSDDDLLAALADALPRPETTASLPTWLSTSNPVWQQAQQQRQQKQPQWQQQQQVQPAPPAKSRIGAHPQRAEQQQQQQQVSSQLQLAPQQPSRQQQQQQRPAQLQPAQQAQQRLAHQAQQVQQAQQQVPQQRPAEILAQLLRQFGPARPVPAQSIARAAHMQARQARQPQQQQAQRPQQPQQPQQQQAQLLRAANGTAASAAAVVQSGSPQGQPGEALPEHMQALARLLLRLSE